jgi:hypothetical protein
VSDPGVITLKHFFDERWFLPMDVVLVIQAAQNFIHGGQQDALCMLSVLGVALYQANKVIDIHIPDLDMHRFAV